MKTAVSIAIALFWASSSAQMSSPLGGKAGAPMRLGFGSEGIAMGNAMAGTLVRVKTGYYNPALVAFQETQDVFVSVGILSLDRGLNFANFSTPLPPSAGLSLGLVNAGVSDIDGRDADGRHTETLSTSENMFMLSFGVRPENHFAVGVTAKIHYYRLTSDMSSTTAGFDIGLAWLATSELAVGMVLQDIGSKYRWDSMQRYGLQGNATTDYFPVRKRLGIAYHSLSLPLTAAVEGEWISEMLMMRIGAALSPMESFTIRAGIDQIGISSRLKPRPSFGFGIQTSTGCWQSHLSYAIVLEPYAPHPMHLVTIGMEFR
ncbi:MAG: hypothetical protein HBSIN02_22000 [Bacteroidia bacterium]|nr:MAG: hypothetical protein HBSIN02_22000 [Bacteroidia bacterium]